MGSHLQQLLRGLCLDTGWNYAVFWKLKYRARMVLTWEDAYYNSHGNASENKISREALESPHDRLGLAVAKMSYHVYSLGEGIVGEVAVTGKHQWIFADQHVVNASSSSEHCNGWQDQFSAGIQTIVVAAIVPHGVVQLGSLNKINEDLKFVTYIKNVFSTLQDSSACLIGDQIQYGAPCLSNMSHISSTSLGAEALHESLLDLDRSVNKGDPGTSAVTPCPKKQGNNSDGDLFVAVDTVRSVGNHGKAVQSMTEKRESLAVSLADEIPNGIGRIQPEPSCLDNVRSSLLFSVGSELHEALGPAYLKQFYPRDWESDKFEPILPVEIPDVMESSMLTSEMGSDHLLEAVIANFCQNDDMVKSAKSLSTSESMLTTEKMPEPSNSTNHTMGSTCYSIDCSSLLEESTQHGLNSSGSCSVRSSTSARASEPVKPNKKRARPGESCRPRPRDRQLIQDRIKELRELVPNGSKCSIDSLLERTIKHMVFLQSITKHADKLNSFAKSKVCSKEVGGIGSSSYEQGSSWAVEVGGHMKIGAILVENINTNSQMLIEMLCEDCEHFLEIAEAIRTLGLTILKGVTDNRGDKTWMRFMVEGQNNRSMHRMDVLWSLVQLFQSKTTHST